MGINRNNYHVEVFFKKYNRLLDKALIRKDREGYKRKLDLVGKALSGIDTDRNLLIVCNRDIAKEIFLCAFMNLPTLREYDFLNLVELMDILMGKRSDGSLTSRSEEDTYESLFDVMRDVVCVTCNYYEAEFHKTKSFEDNLISLIMRRYEYIERDVNKPLKLTWVFHMGTYYDLKQKFPTTEMFFQGKKKDNAMFNIIDLNDVLGGVLEERTPNDKERVHRSDSSTVSLSLGVDTDF
jgi:hypothetical protein